jgi:hypothetical protein
MYDLLHLTHSPYFIIPIMHQNRGTVNNLHKEKRYTREAISAKKMRE